MCGIYSILGIKNKEQLDKLRSEGLQRVKRIRHRGPDWSGVFSNDNTVIFHERLSIVDVEHGAQPLVDDETKRVLAVNGEIYNHKELKLQLKKKHPFKTESDCEPILYLFDEMGPDFLKKLNGIFAFVLYDPGVDQVLIGRDPMGVIPLYLGLDIMNQLHVASELKVIVDICPEVFEFPPGYFYFGRPSELTTKKIQDARQSFIQYYLPEWAQENYFEKNNFHPCDLNLLRTKLTEAVKRQLMCDVPYGVLISGGVDSSIISYLANSFRKNRIEDHEKSEAWWPRLHSFSVGLLNSPDLKFAKIVADSIGSVHHEIHFTIQEGLDAVSDVIYHLETFDITTIRAGTPMFLMSRKIKAMGIKMVLSGEGADEIFGGYLYFHKAPNAKEFHDETVRKISQLHLYDCLRANKSTAS
jgi:asparagine synthase (glutamine-hydrolysing)